jgi:hypothetical protein
MDKSKFTERPGDSEGFVERENPRDWQEVDGVKLPPVSPWAQIDQRDLDSVHAIWASQGNKGAR